jgi:hypothetical protein
VIPKPYQFRAAITKHTRMRYHCLAILVLALALPMLAHPVGAAPPRNTLDMATRSCICRASAMPTAPAMQ